MLNRFGRDYELNILFPNGDLVTILPEINIDFESEKSIQGGLNSSKLQIYNLEENKRNRLVKDREDSKAKILIEFKAGYSKLETIFKGDLVEGNSVRSGADIITTLEIQDGLFDLQNSFTSKTVRGKITDEILKDMPNTNKGKITNESTLLRPRVLVGNSLKLIEENLNQNETYYIDDGALNILKPNEITSDYAPVVSAETGLIDTPKKSMNEISFKTLLNPQLRIGGLCELISTLDKRLNGLYKIVTIKTSGSYQGSNWEQEVTVIFQANYKVV